MTGPGEGLKRTAAWVLPVAVLVPWLAVITSRQTALFPLREPLPDPPPAIAVVLVVVTALSIRLIAPSLATHVVALAVTTCGVALLAAQLGNPLANATADYCGDFCRTAIISRFITFFGWPIAMATVLLLLARRSRSSAPGGPGLVAWNRPWAIVTVITGFLSSVVWWRSILPDG